MARKRIRNWLAVSILFLSLVAIVITGFGTGGGGGLDSLGGGSSQSGTELARVGNRPITTTEANDRLNQDFQTLRRQLPNADMVEFLNQNGFEGAVDRLIALETMRQFGEARGIVVTRRMADRLIAGAPDFRNANGEFDQNQFQAVLQRAGVSEAQLRQDVRNELMRQQLLAPIQSGFRMPAGVARAYAGVPMERRVGQVVTVPLAPIARGLNPSDAEVAQFYRRNPQAFRVAERRVVKYALIGPEHVNVAAPTEAEIASVYANTPRYQRSESRTLQSITFSGAQAQQQATAFAQRVRGGTAFVAAAQGAGFQASDVTFPNQSQTQFAAVTNADIAVQAFRAQRGETIGPVRSPLGVHVVRVETVTINAGRPLASVREAIVREITRRKTAAAVNAFAASLEQQLADSSFEEVARNARLTVVTSPSITAEGLQANGAPFAMSAELRAILPVAFEMDPDSPDPALQPLDPNGRYALVGVDRVDPAAPPPLAEIRDRVRAGLIGYTARIRARDIARGIARRVNEGMPLAQAVAAAGATLPAPQQISGQRGQVLGEAGQRASVAMRLLFRLRPGTAEALRAPRNDGWLVVVPTQSLWPEPAIIARQVQGTQTELSQTLPGEAERQLIRAMSLRVGVQRNAAEIAAERRRISSNLAPE